MTRTIISFCLLIKTGESRIVLDGRIGRSGRGSREIRRGGAHTGRAGSRLTRRHLLLQTLQVMRW